MSDSKVYYPPEGLANEAYISSIDTYNEWYRKSVKQPAEFWTNISSQFHWEVKPRAENALSYNFDLKKGHIFIRWFSDGKTNLCYNCLDRHVKNGLGSKVAFLWEGNDPNDRKTITYQELLTEVGVYSLSVLSCTNKNIHQFFRLLPSALPFDGWVSIKVIAWLFICRWLLNKSSLFWLVLASVRFILLCLLVSRRNPCQNA